LNVIVTRSAKPPGRKRKSVIPMNAERRMMVMMAILINKVSFTLDRQSRMESLYR
jgi:hypothetical protein